jgi:hypothetical protein
VVLVTVPVPSWLDDLGVNRDGKPQRKGGAPGLLLVTAGGPSSIKLVLLLGVIEKPETGSCDA